MTPELMTDEEQTQFARYVRERLPEPVALHAITHLAARVLGRPRLHHWRDLTRYEARQVMDAARREHHAAQPSPSSHSPDGRATLAGIPAPTE